MVVGMEMLKHSLSGAAFHAELASSGFEPQSWQVRYNRMTGFFFLHMVADSIRREPSEDAVLHHGLKAGIARLMNSSNKGTVKAMSPCAGLKTIPFLINFARTGPRLVTFTLKISAMSPVR
jgi:hypothetical protein